MATTAISVQQYLSTTYRPDCDYVNGELRGRNLGEKEHALLQTFLAAWFFNHRKAWGIVPAAELRVQVSPQNFRVPDLCLVRAGQAFDRILLTPPLLCIEVMSPEDRLTDVRRRIQDYVDMGVKDIWLLDPQGRGTYVCVDGNFEEFLGDALRLAASEIFLPLGELWAELD